MRQCEGTKCICITVPVSNLPDSYNALYNHQLKQPLFRCRARTYTSFRNYIVRMEVKEEQITINSCSDKVIRGSCVNTSGHYVIAHTDTVEALARLKAVDKYPSVSCSTEHQYRDN